MTAMAHTTTTRRVGRAEFDQASALDGRGRPPGVVRAMVNSGPGGEPTAARPDCSSAALALAVLGGYAAVTLTAASLRVSHSDA